MSAIAVLVAVLGFAAPVTARVAGPEVQWAGSVSDDLGRVQVSASAEAGVTRIVAHVVARDTGAVVGTTDSFQLHSGTTRAGIWRSDRLPLPALGFYRLDIEVTDADGGLSWPTRPAPWRTRCGCPSSTW